MSICVSENGVNPCIAFPFGHGLSYTTFKVSQPAIKRKANGYSILTKVTNTGKIKGAEVVQVYAGVPSLEQEVGDRTGKVIVEPPKRLVGYKKIFLAPNSSQNVTIDLDISATNHPLSVWSQNQKKWVVPNGLFTVYVCTSASLSDLKSLNISPKN